MIRKSVQSLCLAALAACSQGGNAPVVAVKDLTGGAAPLVDGLGGLSPDGKRVAYSMQIEGVSAVYVAGADGSNPVRLTHGIFDEYPVWSPDGRWIAYYSDHNADVWVVPSAGGESRQLTSGPAADVPTGWLRDGTGVILRRFGAGNNQTLVAPLDGGPVRPLFAAPVGNVEAYPSPDGSKVAYILVRGGRSTLWVQSAAGGPVRQLTTDGLEDARAERMWSPDGKWVLYTSRRTGTTDLWVANVETGELRQLTQDIRNDWGGTWSPDGRWVLFASDRGGQVDLWVVPAQGGAARRVTNDLAGEGNPDWSPDGRTVVYTSERARSSIDVLPAEGGPPRTLVPLEGYSVWGNLQQPEAAAVSPDGRTVLYVSNRSGDWDIWSVPLAGGETTQFAASPVFDGDPAWSPDGRQVAFTSLRGGTADIWVVPAGGGAARQLTDWPSNEGGARWSPDGSTIAFASTREATLPEVWTIPAAGGQARRITHDNADALQVRWAPDGRTLFYTGGTVDGSRQLFSVPAMGGTPRQLTRVEGGANISGDAVSPDGAHVAYSYLVAGLAYLEVMPTAGGPSRRFHTDSTRAWQTFAAWSPDGSRIVVSDWNYETNRGNLLVVTYPQGVARRLTTTTDAFEYGAQWTPDGRALVFASGRGTESVMSANVSRLLAAARP
jgi:Tol biopolymer transport system component